MGKGYLEMDNSQEEGGGGGLWCAINNAQKLTCMETSTWKTSFCTLCFKFKNKNVKWKQM